jgi:hypothetical protein
MASTATSIDLRLTDLGRAGNTPSAIKFDGDFARGSQTYGGTGTLKYSW